MSDALPVIAALAVVALASWGLPALTLRLLEPRFRRKTVPNFRGREVYLGLGWAWIAWVVAVLLVRVAAFALVFASRDGRDAGLPFEPVLLASIDVPVLLTAGAFLFGWLDDIRGTSEFRGFRGHLRALGTGRVTTGLLKLVGVGALAVLFGYSAARSQPGVYSIAIRWPLAAVVIAASANLVNLFDLRPGRALKVYTVLALAGAVLAPVWYVFGSGASVAGFTLSVLVLLLGPALAIWPYDLCERGMLGDAGANAAGALAGYMLAANLPLPALAVAAALLVGLNLASERVSFSAVIERTPALRALDRLGRLPQAAEENPSAESV